MFLAAVLGLAALLAWRRFQSGAPALGDFVAFYTGAAMSAAGAPDPYSLAEQKRLQQELAGGRRFMPYVRPPLEAAILRPLAWLKLEKAALLWLAFNALAALALGLWCARRMGEPLLMALLAVFVPLLVAINVGQDTPMLALLLAAWLCLLEKDKPTASGLLLALLWVKPQWLPPFVLLLAARRQGRALAAFAAASLAIWIAFPPISWVQFIWSARALPEVAPCVECMPNLRALLPGTLIQGASSLAIWGTTFIRARRDPLPNSFAVACAAAVLAGYHGHVYDCLLVVPALAAAATPAGNPPGCAPLSVSRAGGPGPGRDRVRQFVLGLALSPLPYISPYLSAWLLRAPALAMLAVFVALATATRSVATPPPRLQSPRRGGARIPMRAPAKPGRTSVPPESKP